ncbi:MAG: winged helix-turn-helix domain-containing protein [Caldilineaceae bacterium SB0662_bin_9]|uniref:Winged helix-turn-helix domain-containing protein n=1 Tax=Caldilineaceae bacterium SB0662_bin_9 TaxID=2605258 RepID=A0A6B1DUM0_9CHLR|nr:winged helix-turn-helix domain-containing protein [Caldilineaceae bacterium SB0662_bin_9]
MTPVQQEALVAEAAQGVFATAQAVRDWIEAEFGVVYTVGSMYTLLPRLGIRLKTPRPRHPKADPQAQTAWKKGGSGPG